MVGVMGSRAVVEGSRVGVGGDGHLCAGLVFWMTGQPVVA